MNTDGVHGHDDKKSSQSLISPEFLRIITLWSVIPAYLIAGAALGYFADKLFGTAPYILGVCLLIALILAVRDVARIRREW
jgi:F0F1-type ATP synthase assembly protein I